MYRSMFDCASLPMVGRWSRRESRPRCGLRAEGGGCGQRQARGGFGGGKAYPPPFERWDKLCVGKQSDPSLPRDAVAVGREFERSEGGVVLGGVLSGPRGQASIVGE
jgi:hypothetical protein